MMGTLFFIGTTNLFAQTCNPGNPGTTILFVKSTPTGTGDGSSWDNAFDGRFLAWYLRNKVVHGTKIFVAKGVYLPFLSGCDTGSDVRTFAFEWNKNIRLRGGFSATATGTDTITTYNPITNLTRLSGDIGITGTVTDNSYNVVRVNDDSFIDGFYISDGCANGSSGVYAGGAGLLNQSENLILSNIVVEKNNAKTVGGGIYSIGNLTLINATVSDNRAGYDVLTGTWPTSGDGGGIYARASLVLKGDIVCLNDSTSISGGGIFKNSTGYFDASELTSLTIQNCAARIGAGGGINTQTNVVIIVSGIGNVSNNTARQVGGGIYNANELQLAGNFTISGNRSGYDLDTDTWVFSYAVGGAGIWSSNKLTLQGSMIFEHNQAGTFGGAIGKEAAGLFNASGLTSLTVRNNIARNSVGGGIYTLAELDLSGIGNVVFENNTSKGSGGAIYTESALTLEDARFLGNKAGYDVVSGTWQTGSIGGGGIYTSKVLTLLGTVELENNNAGGNGGSIYKTGADALTVAAPGKLIMNQNTAVNGSGGGIYIESPLNITDCQITNNSSFEPGGGIFGSTSGTSMNISNSVISNNSSQKNGGGIYSNGPLTILNDSITDNKAGYTKVTQHFSGSYSGGGVYANEELNVDGTMVLEDNMAALHGGAIYKSATGSFITNNAKSLTIRYNEVLSGYGGGIYTAADLMLKGQNNVTIEIRDNSATSGGGIYASASLTLDSLYIRGNKANVSGGGVYTASSAARFASRSNTFAENTATLGAAIYAISPVEINNNTFSTNRATTSGGGAFLNNADTKVLFSTFNGNVALSGSGLYLNNPSGMTINGNILYGNDGPEISPTTGIDGNYNVIKGTSNPFTGLGNKIVASSKADSIFAPSVSGDLATLADNGGLTPTFNILRNGIANNLIPVSAIATWGITTDQRGEVRPSGCKVDAGAVELQVVDVIPEFSFADTLVCFPNTVDLKELRLMSGDTTGLVLSYYDNSYNLLNSTVVSSAGMYHIEGVNVNGCSDISDVNVSFKTIEPIISGPAIVYAGISYDYQGNGDAGSSNYYWSAGAGSTISGQGANEAVISWTTPGMDVISLTYNIGACQGTGTLDVEILKTEDLIHADFSVNDTVQCYIDNNFIFTNTTKVTLPNEIVSYLWDFGDGSTSTEINAVHKYTKGDTYIVTLIVYGTLANDTVTQTIRILAPSMERPSDQVVCVDNLTQEVIFKGNADLYSWKNSISIGLADGSDPIHILPFTAKNSAKNTVIDTIVVTPRLKVNDLICLGDTVKFRVTVNPTSVPTITGGADACSGSEVTYTTESGMSNYDWKVVGGQIISGGSSTDNTITIRWNSSGSGTVSVNYTNTSGCRASGSGATKTVILQNATTIIDQPSSSVILCSGEPLSLSVIASGSVLTYQWYLNGAAIVGATGSTYYVASGKPSNSGDYYVVVTGTCNSVRSNTSSVSVSIPDIVVQKWENVLAVLCLPSENGGYEFVDFQWYKNGSLMQGETKSYLYVSGVIDYSAVYSVKLTTKTGAIFYTCGRTFIPKNQILVNPYPNPVGKGQTLTVDISGVSEKTAVDWVLTDYKGIMLQRQSMKGSRATITMPGVSGIYILRVNIATTTPEAKYFKVIVN